MSPLAYSCDKGIDEDCALAKPGAWRNTVENATNARRTTNILDLRKRHRYSLSTSLHIVRCCRSTVRECHTRFASQCPGNLGLIFQSCHVSYQKRPAEAALSSRATTVKGDERNPTSNVKYRIKATVMTDAYNKWRGTKMPLIMTKFLTRPTRIRVFTR